MVVLLSRNFQGNINCVKLLNVYDLHIERVSERIGDYNITNRIERSINRAEIIICDVTEKSLDVYFDLGYASAKGKMIIVTAKEGTTLPFDMGRYRPVFMKTNICCRILFVMN